MSNRIGKGKFTINGVTYALACNNGENRLHGGLKGFDKVVWKARDVSTGDADTVELTYLSRDMEEGTRVTCSRRKRLDYRCSQCGS